MAICKMCHKVIPDGRDFCDECEIKRTNQADANRKKRWLTQTQIPMTWLHLWCLI